MAFVCISKRKGGVGASTVAASLAGAWAGMGRSVVLIDSDPQQSAMYWGDVAEAENGILSRVTRSAVHEDDTKLADVIEQAKAEADFVILDARPGLHVQTVTLAMESDVTLIPCGPSPLDLSPLRDMLSALHRLRAGRDRPEIGMVPTRFSERTRLGRELPGALESTAQSLGAPAHVLPGLALRVGYAECVLEGLTPEEHGDVLQREARALAQAVEEML